MSKLTPKLPFDFSPRGGMIHDLGNSYVTEVDAIYQHINNLRENAEELGVEPQAHQLKITDNGNIYIRNTENTEWVYMGKVEQNFGMKDIGFMDKDDLGFSPAEVEGEKNTLSVNITGNAAQIANVLIAVQALSEGEALVYDATNKRFVNKKVPIIDDITGKISVSTTGSAGALGDKPVLTTNIQDGEILVYRPSMGGFVNETKATGVGAKEISFTLNDDILLKAYSGTATTNVSLLAIGPEEPTGTDASLPPFWIATEA